MSRLDLDALERAMHVAQREGSDVRDDLLAIALRNAAPDLLARARLCERMAEALRNMVDATEHTYCSPTPEGHIAGESIRRVQDKARAVLREWDALNAEKGGTE